MARKCVSIMCMVLLIAGMMLTVSCGKKELTQPADTGMGTTSTTGTATSSGSGNSGYDPSSATGSTSGNEDWNINKNKAVNSGEISAQERQADTKKFVNRDIYFDYDSSALTAEAQSILREKSDYMRKYPNTRITIEGHCDERGTFEYNLALGDRRAESVKAYLSNLGVSAARITTISYGEEKPLDPGQNETAWQRNRRANFIL